MPAGNTTLVKLHTALSFINDVLLIPMFTIVTLEICASIAAPSGSFFELSNLGFCISFGAEWAVGLLIAKSRLAYLRDPMKLLDLVSSIPVGHIFQSIRVVRLLRVLRLARAAWRARRYQGPALRFLRSASVIVAAVCAGALALRVVEPENITGMVDALWWSVTTVTTSDFVEVKPDTNAGKVVAAILSTLGVGVFGYIAGFLSTIIEDPEEQELLQICNRLESKVDALSAEVQNLRRGPSM